VAAAQRGSSGLSHMVAAHDLAGTIYLQSGRSDLAAKESRAPLAGREDQQAVTTSSWRSVRPKRKIKFRIY